MSSITLHPGNTGHQLLIYNTNSNGGSQLAMSLARNHCYNFVARRRTDQPPSMRMSQLTPRPWRIETTLVSSDVNLPSSRPSTAASACHLSGASTRIDTLALVQVPGPVPDDHEPSTLPERSSTLTTTSSSLRITRTKSASPTGSGLTFVLERTMTDAFSSSSSYQLVSVLPLKRSRQRRPNRCHSRTVAISCP